MKFRFYLITLLAVSALISCSKDDDSGTKEPDMSPDATFSLSVENLQTRALATDAVDPKDRITKLSVIVYIGDDYYTMKDSSLVGAPLDDPKVSLLQVQNIPVKSGNVKILVLANATNSADFKNKPLTEALTLKTSGLINEKHSHLTMSSGVIKTTLGVSVHNYLGYADKEEGAGIKVCSKTPVKLYRNVARIQLSGLTLQETTDYGKAVRFKLNKIYVANAKSHSRWMSEAEWGAVEVLAETTEGFWWQGILGNKGEYNKNTYDYSEEHKELLYDFTTSHAWNEFAYYDETSEKEPMSDIVLDFKNNLSNVIKNIQTNDNVVFPIGNFFYVYENKAIAPGAQTMLILCGDYTYIPTGSTDEKTIKNTNYSFVINETGTDVPKDLAAHKGIMRNTKYSLSLTIKGPGSPTPDPDSRAYLGAKVKVNEWGLIEIDATVD